MSQFDLTRWTEAVEQISADRNPVLPADANVETREAARLIQSLGIPLYEAPEVTISTATALFQPKERTRWADRVGFVLGLAGARLSAATEVQWAFELDDLRVRMAAEVSSDGWSVMGRTSLTQGEVRMVGTVAQIGGDGSFTLSGPGELPKQATVVAHGIDIALDLTLDSVEG